MRINKNTRIGVVCGGISNEREISLKSGKNCFDALIRLGYKNTFLIDIKKTDDLFNLKKKQIEVAFLITHGKFGEDGAIQGILEWLQIPYTGSSILGSAIAMDKLITKQIAQNLSILTPPYYLVSKSNLQKINLKTIWEKLVKKNKAIFLKPREEGSSINTFKIKSFLELEKIIDKLDFNHCDYLIEEFIPGREITVSIIEINNKPKVLPILELKPKNEFYDYQAKYIKGLTEFLLPAKIRKDIVKKIKSDSLKVFYAIGCSSFGRVDFILSDNNKPYLLEINSLPGMTDLSDLPAQAKAADINYDELVEIILKTAKLHK
ncbi:MAG: D-alanine--D-alanine ligase [Candidatus Melainabacteria bacterium]|nr:D-alanine--D-alanine ligase [Candidatus Melainabacteria bacterium]